MTITETGMSPNIETALALGYTADIVTSFVGRGAVSAADLPELIRTVYTTISGLGVNAAPEIPEKREPAVPIKKSVTDDFIVCLEDGKKFKSLKRHLHALGMTPEQYRERWGLPANYPMVAPSYSAVRSKLAKDTGLGTKGVTH